MDRGIDGSSVADAENLKGGGGRMALYQPPSYFIAYTHNKLHGWPKK